MTNLAGQKSYGMHEWHDENINSAIFEFSFRLKLFAAIIIFLLEGCDIKHVQYVLYNKCAKYSRFSADHGRIQHIIKNMKMKNIHEINHVRYPF